MCRPSRHQREAATGGDYLSGYEEFVDAMDDIEAMARSGTDRLDRAEQRKPIVDRDPLFAGDVVGGDPLLRREWVVLWHGDIQRLVQQRGDAHTSRPWRRVVEAVCQDDVVVAGERRELCLGDVLVGQTEPWWTGLAEGADQRWEERFGRAA